MERKRHPEGRIIDSPETCPFAKRGKRHSGGLPLSLAGVEWPSEPFSVDLKVAAATQAVHDALGAGKAPEPTLQCGCPGA